MKFKQACLSCYLVFLLSVLIFNCPAQPGSENDKWAFAVLADPRNIHAGFEVALEEVRDHKALGSVSPAKFVLLCGDYDPLIKNLEKFQTVFANVRDRPQLLPVIGGHDLGLSDFNESVAIVKNLKHATRRDDKLNYFVDYHNVRIIAVNAYSDYNNDLGEDGCLTSKGIEWIDASISSAAHADHIFIAMHEPCFPRYRHVNDSFNVCREKRNAFWDMVVSYGDKVKAVFVAHTHYYYRMRVKDPRSPDADDPKAYPDQEDGIYQIDCGACGNGKRTTVVYIEIVGKDIFFKVVDVDDGPPHGDFSLIDEWEISAAQ